MSLLTRNEPTGSRSHGGGLIKTWKVWGPLGWGSRFTGPEGGITTAGVDQIRAAWVRRWSEFMREAGFGGAAI